MQTKIVLDSSADLTAMEGVPFAYAPLKICTAEREFTDDDGISVTEMVDFLYTYKGRSSTSCPNAEDYLAAFGDDEAILCITITGGLSGSCNAARAAADLYREAHPDRRVAVVDSLTAGPEIALMAEFAAEKIRAGAPFDEVVQSLASYKTELVFALESLKNFANNGRVSKAAAAAAGLLGIRAVGRASDEGTLEVLDKTRGEAKTLDAVTTYLLRYGYKGGRIRIHHCRADGAVEKLTERIRRHFPDAPITVTATRGLCSYYAEKGGFLVGFEV